MRDFQINQLFWATLVGFFQPPNSIDCSFSIQIYQFKESEKKRKVRLFGVDKERYDYEKAKLYKEDAEEKRAMKSLHTIELNTKLTTSTTNT